MKRIFIGLFTIVAMVVALSGCDSKSDRTYYDGAEYVMFSDTLSYFPVQNSQDWFKVHVASTVACDYDRNYAIEVDEKKTNAIENKHYVIESNTVTIKAGERSADLKLRGIYENIGKMDSLAVTFRLICKENKKWNLYGETSRVEIMKSCPFDSESFSGYCTLTSSFYNDYMTNTDLRLLKTEMDPTDPNKRIIRDFLYKGYDLKLKFDTTNPLEPFVEMDDQIIGSTAEAFGTTYGNGRLMVTQPNTYTSYYNVCQKYVFQYMRFYVDNVGVVGTYINIIEWITDEEAQQLKNQGY